MTSTEKFGLGDRRGVHRGTIHVGLVNNMPDGAMRATELQFARLLKEAAGAQDVQLHLFSLGAIPRSEQARSRMEGFYADAETLPMAGIDGLIVTGAEPREADFRQEAYWPGLAHLIDWAEIGTVSSVFSCLAAHAAVFHLDGITRNALPRKMSGIFTAARVGGESPLQAGMQSRIHVPHSRRNTLAESDLSRNGYSTLWRVDEGVDSFTKRMPGGSQFLFLQGHPEYAADTLGHEYLRDVGRFLRGESTERPAAPENYFDRATEIALMGLDAETADPGDLARYSAVVLGALPLQSWRAHTLKLFGNWLGQVAAEKLRRRGREPERRQMRA